MNQTSRGRDGVDHHQDQANVDGTARLNNLNMMNSFKAKSIAVWTISILLGLLFVLSGLGKLLSSAGTAKLFEHFGYPAWFGTVIGVIEVIGGIGLLIPRIAKFAAGILGIVMIGAIVSHVRVDELPRALFAVMLLALLGLIGMIRLRKND